MITDMRLLLAQERSVAVAELAVLVLLRVRPDGLGGDACPVLFTVEEAAEKEVVPADQPVERALGCLAVFRVARDRVHARERESRFARVVEQLRFVVGLLLTRVVQVT